MREQEPVKDMPTRALPSDHVGVVNQGRALEITVPGRITRAFGFEVALAPLIPLIAGALYLLARWPVGREWDAIDFSVLVSAVLSAPCILWLFHRTHRPRVERIFLGPAGLRVEPPQRKPACSSIPLAELGGFALTPPSVLQIMRRNVLEAQHSRLVLVATTEQLPDPYVDRSQESQFADCVKEIPRTVTDPGCFTKPNLVFLGLQAREEDLAGIGELLGQHLARLRQGPPA